MLIKLVVQYLHYSTCVNIDVERPSFILSYQFETYARPKLCSVSQVNLTIQVTGVMGLLRIAVLVIIIACNVFCQENAGTNVAPALQICYNTTLYVTRQYRLPSTINTLIDLIRKIEDGNPSENNRELAIQILHRFRQDGIRRTMKDVDERAGIIPFSPKGWETYKNRVQLKKLIPGDARSFNNDSLTNMEACSLHFMISSTIEVHQRGDESTVCSRIAHYTQRLHKRETELAEQVDATNSWTRSRSDCPIESGVIYTKWGAVKAGLVLSGIASGLEYNPYPSSNGTIENTYASTLAGELSEVALGQPSDSKVVGDDGGWNSTLVPRYYFLQNSDVNNLYLTDAEIRGALDGLYLALNVDQWKQRNSDIKISQILDMYYGRGVFNDSARACNRKKLADNLLDDKLTQQTVRLNYLLNEEAQYSYTLQKEALPRLAQEAVDTFKSYLRSNLNDLQCSAENDVIERVATDVLIFIDTAWDHNIIQPFIAYILDNIDVNKFESSYTVFDGVRCDKIVNKTRSILDFYEKYNLTEQQKYPSGFNYISVVKAAEGILKGKLNNETDVSLGQSTILLMLPHNTPSSSDSSYVADKRNNAFKRYLPDLRIIVAGPGSKGSYNDLVTSPNNDIFTLPDSREESSIREVARSVVNRFRKLPRNVVNPQCGTSFTRQSTTFDLTQYVEPFGVNYHRISPQYFVNGKYLKIQGQGFGTLIVCTSRTETNPRANSTGVKCQEINSDERSINIDGYCTESPIDCAPIYISVEGKSAQSYRCTDKRCRFPDSMKYVIRLEEVDCSSSSRNLFTPILFVTSLFVLMRF